VVDIVGGLGLTWQPAFGIILVLYFYSHYFFASGDLFLSVFALRFVFELVCDCASCVRLVLHRLVTCAPASSVFPLLFKTAGRLPMLAARA
jgi:hypothetical protein